MSDFGARKEIADESRVFLSLIVSMPRVVEEIASNSAVRRFFDVTTVVTS